MQLPILTLYHRSFGRKVHKSQVLFWRKIITKNFTFSSFIFRHIIDLKTKVCIYSNSQGHALVFGWNSFPRYFRWTCFSHFADFVGARIARSSSHGLLRQTNKLLYDLANGFVSPNSPTIPYTN